MRQKIKANPEKLGLRAQELLRDLEERIVGQERAIGEFVRAVSKAFVKLSAPNKPLASLLFLGPTGVGKTEVVHALAEILFGDRNYLTRIDCAEFARDHEVSKLIGSPPGYIGHERVDSARLTQEKIGKFATPEVPFTGILLFDEIEKGSEDLHNILLGILEGGKPTLGNGRETDLTKTLVVMTSNLGSREVAQTIHGSGIGFASHHDDRAKLDDTIYRVSRDVARKFFKPEFLNRVDRMVVFRSLSSESLKRILELQLDAVQERPFSAGHFAAILVSGTAKEYLLKEGTDERFGARELRRKIERYIADPVTNLIASGQVVKGDHISIGFVDGSWEYCIERLPAPPRPPKDENFQPKDDFGV